MSQQLQFMDIVFLGIIVLLLVSRLRSVLGTRPDDEEKPETQPSKIVDISEYRTVENQMPAGGVLISDGDEKDHEILAELKRIKVADPDFDVNEFMVKSPRAFEFIAQMFAAGNKDALAPLLSRDIYKRFEKAIDGRKERGEKAEFSLIGFKAVKLTGAALIGSLVELTVEFETEQTNIIKNASDEIIMGDPTYIETVTDVWTFRKELKTSNPIWVLTATHHKL